METNKNYCYTLHVTYPDYGDGFGSFSSLMGVFDDEAAAKFARKHLQRQSIERKKCKLAKQAKDKEISLRESGLTEFDSLIYYRYDINEFNATYQIKRIEKNKIAQEDEYYDINIH